MLQHIVENIMLSKWTSHKRTNVWFHLFEVPKVVKFIESIYQNLGREGNEDLMTKVHRVSLGEDEILEVDGGDGCTIMWMDLVS
jgi:hypothetical protein